jgi:DNA-binding HxlR family transcriptional regulator
MKAMTATTPRRRAGPKRSLCPIACTLDLVGDKWTLLVLRDLFHGKAHFSEFLASPERIATNILAERLARLTESGLVERYSSPTIAGREAYRLTQKGASIGPVLEQISAWGLAHIEGTTARIKRRI